MNKRVEVLNQQIVFKQAIFKIIAAQLRHELFSGEMSEPITHLKLDRGDSVAMLVHDAQAGTILLAEQFRFPTYHAHDSAHEGWLVEIPAGVISQGEAPEQAARREIHEEIGYAPASIELISTFYPSPGGSSERIFLYYANVTARQRTGPGGGVQSEGENIHRINMPVQQAFEHLNSNKFIDAKTIIALQWLRIKQLPKG